MYFLGVTTAQSSVHRIFPRWAELAGAAGTKLIGVDLPVEAEPQVYRAAVERIRSDAESRGGLVTTHKVQVYRHAGDLFAGFEPDARLLAEVSCIVQRGGSLTGIAVDTVTSGMALRAFLPEWPFRGSALILGAGGAAAALAVQLYRAHQPEQVILTDVSAERLQQVRGLTPARCELVHGPEDHDRLLSRMPPGSLVVNATGMGKDRAGAPITAAARFPEGAVAWDFNYRGDLRFLEHARAQGRHAEDGWQYFLHGWSQIMARVLGFALTAGLFAALRASAEPFRPPSSYRKDHTVS